MQKIKLKQELFNRVYSGEKTATTRKGIKNYTVGEAEFINPKNEQEIIKIFIEQVSIAKYGSIKSGNSYLHIYEGYETRKDLCEALESIYGDINGVDYMTIVYYKLR